MSQILIKSTVIPSADSITVTKDCNNEFHIMQFDNGEKSFSNYYTKEDLINLANEILEITKENNETT